MTSPFTVLFQNEHAVIIDKPALWLSIPGRTADDSRPVLGKILEQKLAKKIYPIHRLDAEVSGVIVYGLSAEFHKEANSLFESKAVQKTYQALTDLQNFKSQETMTWTCRIFRGKKRSFEAAHGKDSITQATVVARKEDHLEWRLLPITGRSHQLRFEMARHEAPIIGDALYGSKRTWNTPGIALRAIRIDFPEDFAGRWSLPVSQEASLLPTISPS